MIHRIVKKWGAQPFRVYLENGLWQDAHDPRELLEWLPEHDRPAWRAWCRENKTDLTDMRRRPSELRAIARSYM